MQVYEYRARNQKGELIKGTLNAIDQNELADKLMKMDLFLVDKKMHKPKNVVFFGKVKKREIILLSNHLAVSLEAGITLIQALTDYANELEDGLLKDVLEDIIRQVLSGNSFSDSLSKYPKIFSELYTSIVATGEATGDLDKVLKDLVGFLEWQEVLAGQIKQASIYPLILIGMIGLVIVIMMTFTLPKFMTILDGFKVDLPLPTKILVEVSNIFVNFWYILLISPVIFILIYKQSRKSHSGRLFWDKIKLKIPLFGKLHHKIVLSQFSHYFSMLYGSGIGIIESFNIIERIVDNEVVKGAIRRTAQAVEKGESMYDALKKENTFPHLVLRMIQVGETTGNLDTTLQKASDYYDREVPATIKKIFAVMEPLLIMVLGGFVLFMALSIFLPIYKLVGNIGAQS